MKVELDLDYGYYADVLKNSGMHEEAGQVRENEKDSGPAGEDAGDVIPAARPVPEDGGIFVSDAQEPEAPDCSDDKVPADVTDMEGKKKVLVPELVSMTKVLFDRYRLPMYSFLNRRLRDGTMSELTGSRILNRVINRDVVKFPNVNYWRIDREDFYADVDVELNLMSPDGPFFWKGKLVCWCSFLPELSVSIEELTGSVAGEREDYDPLSKYLVPYATNNDVDRISEKMWREYLPEALSDPQKRDAQRLAELMGLTIVHHPVYGHKGVDSIVFFKEDRLSVGDDRYEKQDGQKRYVKAPCGKDLVIPANTIVVNANRVRREYSGFNIFHECYHYREHYLFFCLQEMASNDLRQVPVKEVLVDKDSEVKDPVYFMEKQADRGALGLMMPVTHTKRMILEECGRADGYMNAGELYEAAGTAMRKKLSLPEFRIRTRMIQLGHLSAKGAMNYVNKEKIEPFAFSHDAWRDSSFTFIIDGAKVTALEEQNEEFRALMKSGKYVYADGHIVRNLPEFVELNADGTGYFLTDSAKKQVDRCCLRFVQKFVQKNTGRYVYGRMYYDAEYVKQCEFYLSDIVNEQQMNLPDARFVYENNFPTTFKEAFEELMHKNNETQETMADKLGTTRRSLREWLKDPQRKISPDFIVWLSLSWKLPAFISSLLFESAGICMNRRNPRNRALEHIRTVMWDQGIDAANSFLKDNNMEILRIQ